MTEAWDDAEETTGIVSGGPDRQGHEVVFAFKTTTGNLWLRCQHGRLGSILDRLRTFGLQAARSQAGLHKPTGTSDVIYPYRLSSNPLIGRSPDNHLALQFPTADGFPVTIAMSREAARRLAEDILAACRKPPPRVRRQ